MWKSLEKMSDITLLMVDTTPKPKYFQETIENIMCHSKQAQEEETNPILTLYWEQTLTPHQSACLSLTDWETIIQQAFFWCPKTKKNPVKQFESSQFFNKYLLKFLFYHAWLEANFLSCIKCLIIKCKFFSSISKWILRCNVNAWLHNNAIF